MIEARGGDADTDKLLHQAGRGDPDATQQLLTRHRRRLKRLVAVRLDPRLAARLDPSDVVQDALAEAAQRLPEYLRQRPLPFYAWLRQLALEQVAREHRRHVGAGARSVGREEQHAGLPDHSALELAKRLLAGGSSPSERMSRDELRQKVRRVLDRLKPHDGEMLALRFLEQLSLREAAEVLGITDPTAKTRQRRALERFTRLMDEELSDSEHGP